MTKKRKPGALYFTDVSRVRRGSVVLTGQYYAFEETEDQRTALLSLKNEEWGGLDLSGIAHAVRFVAKLGRKTNVCLVLERDKGLYRVLSPTSAPFERINEERDGFLMDLRKIGQNWYAVGGHHQIYREDRGAWTAIDDGVYVPGEQGQAKILCSIDGVTESDIYTVGFNGVVFHFDGSSWTQLDSPTNVGFQRVLCVGKDEVYICGNAGTLYRGNTNEWVPLTELDESITFWDMTCFKGSVYVCTQEKLFVVVDDELEEVELPVDGPLAFYRMDSDEDELWTCGDECLLQFDGKSWKQHIFPDNT